MSLKLGIIRTSSIGDVVLASACLDYLEQVAPHAQVVWVGRGQSLELLKRSWPKIIAADLPSRASSAQKKIVKETLVQCDAIIDLQTSLASRLLVFSSAKAGVPIIRAKKAKIFRLKLVFKALARGRFMRWPQEALGADKLQYRMMLEALDLALRPWQLSNLSALDNARPHLPNLSAGRAEFAWERELSFGRWLAVAPGASHEPKRAPTEVFQDVLAALAKQNQSKDRLLGLLLLGGPEDRAVATELIDSIRWEGPILNLAGKLTLDQTMLALGRVSALLSNDSGLSHIAEAVGISVAVLFGPTIESFGFAPWRSTSQAFSSYIGCRPCSRHGKKKCRFGDNLCFQAIDTKAVAEHLTRLIGGGSSR